MSGDPAPSPGWLLWAQLTVAGGGRRGRPAEGPSPPAGPRDASRYGGCDMRGSIPSPLTVAGGVQSSALHDVTTWGL